MSNGSARSHELREITIATYNNSAEALAEYFKGIGARLDDIELAFSLAGDPKNARVLEIGCGDGRDAEAIYPRAGWYHGIDVSDGMINIAQKKVPGASFEVADAATYEYPENLDVVFAFASLLHLDRAEVRQVLKQVHRSLNPGGVFYISLKEMPEYIEEVKDDEFGSRLFFFYNAFIISEMADDQYDVAHLGHKTIGKTNWFEIALQKPSVPTVGGEPAPAA